MNVDAYEIGKWILGVAIFLAATFLLALVMATDDTPQPPCRPQYVPGTGPDCL